MSDEPLPFKASKPLDLRKIAAEPNPTPTPVPMRDVVNYFRLDACFLCLRGGHTGDTLYTVFKDGTGRELAKACGLHVGQFIRPKDVKKR